MAPKAIKTVSAQSGAPPAWYIKGSYVLDVVFRERLGSVQHAADADVFYLRTAARPGKADVEAVLDLHGLPPLPNGKLDGPLPVDNLTSLDAGGTPTFNIDLWHIRETGALLVADGRGNTSALNPNDALASGPLRLLDPSRQPSPKAALKGLMKMALYPPLYHRNLVRVLTRIVDGALS